MPVDAAGSSRTGLSVTRWELIGLIAITAAAVLVRFAYVSWGGSWDQDQGAEMLAIWHAVTTAQLPLFGPPATSVGLPYHHGALYYDLLLPAAWLSRGDPRAILAEIAAANALVVPMLWWIGRSIGGRATGLIVAVMAATSADLVLFSTFIWNPNLIQLGAALAVLGAWQSWRTGNPRWWLAAALGFAVAVQCHETAAVLALPLGAVWLLDLRRTTSRARRRVAVWGLAGVALFLSTYSLVIYHELTNGFPEIQGMASYFRNSPGYVSVSPAARLIFAAIRIPAWPLTGWPYFELLPGLLPAVVVTLATAVGGSLLLLRTWRRGLTISGNEVTRADERHGVAFIVGGLVLFIVALGLGIRAISELNVTMTEQYHIAADPFVLLLTGVAVGAIWHANRGGRARNVSRFTAIAAVVLFVGWNAAHWPPLTQEGTWAAAQAAATRIEHDAAGGQIAMVPLYEPKGVEAYSYPLLRDGVHLVTPDQASTVVLFCDSDWIKTGCGGNQEDQWLRSNMTGPALTLIDRFDAASDRIMSVYRRSP